MKKLIELLKESGKADEICPTGIDIRKQYFDAENITRADRMIYEYLCSKHFGFIKRLVENDKIDLDACEGEKTYNNLTASRDSNYSQYERLLMALAIQDEPIRFLCEILN